MKKILITCILFYTIPIICQEPWQMEEIFTGIFVHNCFGNKESVSGQGSTLYETTYIREAIPALLKKYGIKSMLDIPCGDWNWLRKTELPLDLYIGADVVKALVEKDQRLYGNPQHIFMHLNAVSDVLPTVDLVFCRDMLVHFNFENIKKFFKNLKRSQSMYILTTHFPGNQNIDFEGAINWHMLDFRNPPFNFPEPLEVIHEKYAPHPWNHKSLALWKVADIPDF